VQDWILAILTEIVQDWTSSLVQDWIFLYIDLYFIFPDSEKMAKFKCYYCPTASSKIQDILDHHVKDHKAFKLKIKVKILEEKSGKWGFQTKDFDFIAGDVLNDSIFKKH
jgi:hypothetical protein